MCTLNSTILFSFRAGKPPPGLHLDVMKGDKLMEVTDTLKMLLWTWWPCLLLNVVIYSTCIKAWVVLWELSSLNAPDTSLTVHFVPDVLRTGLFYGCMALNGARAASALGFKLFSGKQH